MCSLIISVFQYQAWRQEFQVLQEHGYYGPQASHYCRLCQALNYNSRESKIYPSISNWFGRSHCRPAIGREWG